MEERKFPQTKRFAEEGFKRIKSEGNSDELINKIHATRQNTDENIEPPFSTGLEYLAEHFGRQAEGLAKLRLLNDSAARRQKALPLLQRRKEMLDSLQAALKQEPFTDREAEQLRWMYDFGSAFVNLISKNMGIFSSLHGTSKQKAAVEANLSTAELQHSLAQLLIQRTRMPSESTPSSETRETTALLKENVFSLLNSMCVRAMGLSDGTHLHNVIESGAYGTAAAYLMYSDPTLNKFRKSFRVFFPSPYLDAMEQTDLLLVDEANLQKNVREEIRDALEKSMVNKPDAINNISAEAKKHVYKVQVKSRRNGSPELTSDEEAERERFIRHRCMAKGFDNYDYLVLTGDRARAVVDAASNPERGSV